MKFRRPHTQLSSRPDLVPMIDVMFVLNVFLLLNARVLVPTGIPIDLPADATAEVSASEESEVLVDEQDRLWLKGKNLSLDELCLALRALPRETRVVVKADRKSSYGRAIEVFDALRGLKFLRVSLATRPSSAQKAQ